MKQDIQVTADGGFIMAGQSKSNNGDVSGNHGTYDFWIVKLDVEIISGISSFGKKDLSPQLYPNPVSDVLTVSDVPENLIIRIFDAGGKLVYDQKPGNYENTIDIEGLNNGVYTIQFIQGKNVSSRKFVVEK